MRLLDALFAFEPQVATCRFQRRALHVPASPLSVEFNIFGSSAMRSHYDIVRFAYRRGRALRRRRGPSERDEVRRRRDFHQQSTVAAANESAAYVFITSGPQFAGLGDEYVGSVTYETGAPIKAEPWEPNITALHDPSALKWRDSGGAGDPRADTAVVRRQGRRLRGCRIRSARSVSARGHVHHECAHVVPFCRVCQRAINRIIDLHTN